MFYINIVCDWASNIFLSTMITYLLLGLPVIPIFFYLENKWPAPQWKHNYPRGKPHLWWFCWVAAIIYTILWPFTYLCVIPDTIRDKNGNANHCNYLKNSE